MHEEDIKAQARQDLASAAVFTGVMTKTNFDIFRRALFA